MRIALVQITSPSEESPSARRDRVRGDIDPALVAATRAEFPVLADRLDDYRTLRTPEVIA